MTYIFNDIIVSPLAEIEEAFFIVSKKIKQMHLSHSNIEMYVFKKSIDARKIHDIKIVYSIAVKGIHTVISKEVLQSKKMAVLQDYNPKFEIGDQKLHNRPVIVGAGPAGLFCAYLLALQGYRPLVIERGASIEERSRDVEHFYKNKQLNIDSNIQYGAGGAGTFSDGKLVTRVNDPLSQYVMRVFVECGAPEEIIVQAKPHVGTDYLKKIIQNLTKKIEELGGEISYHTKMEEIVVSNNRIMGINTNKGEISVGLLILAIGNCSRDTFRYLIRNHFSIEAKPFSVGMRIEHLQKDVDHSLYGDSFEKYKLPHAEYHLSANTQQRGVYTFCMCPGGQVVAAQSEENTIVVNGMSNHARNFKNANSAVVVSIFKEDINNDPLTAIDFQTKIERNAFVAGGNNYNAPIITVGDFLDDSCQKMPTTIQPTYMNGDNFNLCTPTEFLPSVVVDHLKLGIRAFTRNASFFADPNAVLTGAETRTSSPIRIVRIEDGTTNQYCNLYPCGEGAGYAGGIMSAAIDGIHVAEKIISRYSPEF